MSVQVCKILYCIITTIIINNDYNIELRIEKLCHETNSLKSDFVPDYQSHSMMINFTCQKLVIASDFPKYLLTSEKDVPVIPIFFQKKQMHLSKMTIAKHIVHKTKELFTTSYLPWLFLSG